MFRIAYTELLLICITKSKRWDWFVFKNKKHLFEKEISKILASTHRLVFDFRSNIFNDFWEVGLILRRVVTKEVYKTLFNFPKSRHGWWIKEIFALLSGFLTFTLLYTQLFLIKR